MHLSNIPYLTYNEFGGDGVQYSRPTRTEPGGVDGALLHALQLAAEDIRSSTGQHQASFGEPSNEKSGVAIRERQREADTATFHFVDNLNRSMRHLGRIIVDMLPHVIDAPRVMRILGEDETPAFANIDPTASKAYQRTQDVLGRIVETYNPGVGRYDVVSTTGPSYGTRRQEAFESMSQVLTAAPQLWAVMGDLLIKSMDWPGADDMAERLKAMLPPEIQQIEEARAQGAENEQAKMEQVKQAMMAQIQPAIEEMQQALEQAGVEVEQRDQAIAELTQRLESRQAEVQARLEEAQLKAQADIESQRIKGAAEVERATIESESELAVAMMQHRGGQVVPLRPGATSPAQAKPDNGEQVEGPEEDEEMGGIRSLIEAMSSAIAVQLSEIAEQQDVNTARLDHLQAQLDDAELRRSEVNDAVFEYLQGPQDAEDFTATVAKVSRAVH